MTSPSPPDLLQALAGYDSGTVSDALDSLGISGVLTSLTRITTAATVVGSVVTVQLGPDDGTPSTRHLGTAAIDAADSRSVILVAGGADDAGGWGGLLSRAARHKGVRGVVVEGAVRDVDEAEALGFPLFAHRATPRTARRRQRETGSGTPVVVDGVRVEPGDLLVADGTGVVVVPLARAAEVVAAAQAVDAREQAMVGRLDAGEQASQVLGRSYESMLETKG